MKKILLFCLLISPIFFLTGCGYFSMKKEIIKPDNSTKIENDQSVDKEKGHNCSEYTFENNLVEKPLEQKEFAKEIIINGNLDAQRFEKEILEALTKGPNFAFRYTIVEVGCGSNCQAYFIVDSFTGELQNWNLNSVIGIKYRNDSNLIILNPIENIDGEESPLGKPQTTYYIVDIFTEPPLLNKICTIN